MIPSLGSVLACNLYHCFTAVVGTDGSWAGASHECHYTPWGPALLDRAGRFGASGVSVWIEGVNGYEPETEACGAAAGGSQSRAKAGCPAPTWSWSTSSSPVIMMRFSIRVSENPPFTVCTRRRRALTHSCPTSQFLVDAALSTGGGTMPASP